MDIETYLTERVDNQIEYFDSKAIRNQKIYKRLKGTAIFSNVFTTLTIALALTFISHLKFMGIAALILSTIVLATYQIEEFYNFGAKWEKFRLVAERIKSEKYLFLSSVGRYASIDTGEKERVFIEAIEGIIQGTDMSYFSLMIEPGKGIEKRL
ncbi:MAG: DUF4231 domain-containing protein [Candidatus Poribacteria bacterium]|nr:DUF4231 domain-containing protein [Candidatus Poribacteria bacterium]